MSKRKVNWESIVQQMDLAAAAAKKLRGDVQPPAE